MTYKTARWCVRALITVVVSFAAVYVMHASDDADVYPSQSPDRETVQVAQWTKDTAMLYPECIEWPDSDPALQNHILQSRGIPTSVVALNWAAKPVKMTYDQATKKVLHGTEIGVPQIWIVGACYDVQ